MLLMLWFLPRAFWFNCHQPTCTLLFRLGSWLSTRKNIPLRWGRSVYLMLYIMPAKEISKVFVTVFSSSFWKNSLKFLVKVNLLHFWLFWNFPVLSNYISKTRQRLILNNYRSEHCILPRRQIFNWTKWVIVSCTGHDSLEPVVLKGSLLCLHFETVGTYDQLILWTGLLHQCSLAASHHLKSSNAIAQHLSC